MEHDANERQGGCHCGKVRFRVKLTDDLNTARRCTCSLCRMRGAIAVSADVNDITITEGAELLSSYRFNTMTAVHHFCSNCGIYTHHQRRSNPNQLGINVACLDGVSPFDFEDVVVNDGVTHPSDRKSGSGIAGYLHFTPVQ